MKPLILFLSLLLAFSGCKSKLQEAQEEELNSIVGTWLYIGSITRDCNKEKPDTFNSARRLEGYTITYHNDFSYIRTYSALVYPGCSGNGVYSLSTRKEADGTPVKIMNMRLSYCLDGSSPAYDSQYDVVRASNGNIHLHLSSDPADCKNSYYTVSVYKKI